MSQPSQKPEPGEKKSIRVLLIEDAPDHAKRIELMLRQSSSTNFHLEWHQHLSPGKLRLSFPHTDVILLDLGLEESEGLNTFKLIREMAPNLPIIVLSSTDDDTLAVEAVHGGAQDYLVKGKLERPLLVRSIRYALERHRAEAALLQAEEKYRSIFEHIVEGIFQTTPDGRYLSANPALARIYGYDSVEELTRRITDIGTNLYVEPNRRREFVRLMQEYDVVTNFESAVRRKDGTQIWISENVRAVRDSFGKLRYYEGTVEDITERKRTEERLRNSEALYHSLVENLPQYILRKDLNERFTFANQKFCKMLGKPLEEILGKTDFDFFPADLASKYQQDDRQVMETGKLLETIEEHQPPAGEKLYVNVVKSPIYDAHGQIIGLQGIFWDITERVRAQERERKANAELARSREELAATNLQMEDDLKMAAEIQQAIMPQQYPSFPSTASPEESRIRFAHRYYPTGAVGGDFFNVISLSDTLAGVFICDVMGHGVRSALVTAMVRALVEELKGLGREPGRLLGQLNSDLRMILRSTGSPTFTTALYLLVDIEQKELHFANAGHPKPLLIRREDGTIRALDNPAHKPSAALGLFENSIYPATTVPIREGDLVMLFTDGLYEVEGPDASFYSQEMLLEAIRKQMALPAGQLFDALLEEIRKFSLRPKFVDDVCLVGIDVKA